MDPYLEIIIEQLGKNKVDFELRYIEPFLELHPECFSPFANALIAYRQRESNSAVAGLKQAYDDLALLVTCADLRSDEWMYSDEPHPLADEFQYGPLMWALASYVQCSGYDLLLKVNPEAFEQATVFFRENEKKERKN